MHALIACFFSLLIIQYTSYIKAQDTSSAPLSIIPVTAPQPAAETPPVAPVLPTPVETTPIAIQPIAAPATTPQPTPPTTAPATTPSSPVKPTDLTPEIEQEFKTLTTTLDEIRAAKKELVDILSMLDKKQEEGRAEIVQAQKTAKEILNATQEADAQTQLAKVTENLKKITALETEINNDLAKKFDDGSKKVNDLINKARTSIATLQGKGIALQMIQAKIQTTNKEAKDAETTQGATTSKLLGKNAQEKTWWDSVVNFCAKVGHRIKRAFKKIKTMASATETGSDEKKKSSETIKEVTQNIQALATLPTEKPSNAISATVKNNTAEIEAIGAKLQTTQNKITATVDELNKQNTELMTTLNITTQEKTDANDPTWKRISVFVFSEFLDVAAFIVNGTKDICIWLYHKTLGPLITKFTTDVQEKIKSEEQKDIKGPQNKNEKPATELPPIPTPPAQENTNISAPAQIPVTPEQIPAAPTQPSAIPEQTTPTPETLPAIPVA